MQNLNQVEINEVSGALALNIGLGSLTLDPVAILNNVISTGESLLASALGLVPTLPVITIPALGLSLSASVG